MYKEISIPFGAINSVRALGYTAYDSKFQFLLVRLIEEAMLTFLRDYFGLQSLEMAQNITLYEYITARKISYNNAKFQKNLIAIQKIKI